MVQDRIYNYFERNPQLHVLFIFDRMNIIQNELDEMKQWNDDYIYKRRMRRASVPYAPPSRLPSKTSF